MGIWIISQDGKRMILATDIKYECGFIRANDLPFGKYGEQAAERIMEKIHTSLVLGQTTFKMPEGAK